MTRKVQGVLTTQQSVVEKLPSFVKLVSPFRKPINQHIISVEVCCFFDLTHLSAQLLGCMVVVEMPGM